MGQTVNLTVAEVAALPLELSRTAAKGAAACAAIDDVDENPPDPESNDEQVTEPAGAAPSTKRRLSALTQGKRPDRKKTNPK